MLRRAAVRLQHTLVRPKGQALILLYHRVAEGIVDPWRLCVTPEHFAQQTAILRQRCHPIGLDEMVEGMADGMLPPRSVAVTFDDGYTDNLTHAQPVLEQNAVPATIFLATGYLGTDHAFWWDELAALLLEPGVLPDMLSLTIRDKQHCWHLGDSARYSLPDFQRHRHWRAWERPPTPRHALYRALWLLLRPLSGDERQCVLKSIRAWACPVYPPISDGLPLSCAAVVGNSGDIIRFGCHSVSHPSLAALPIAAQRAEVTASKAQLEQIVGCRVTTFSYPFGKVSDYSADTAAVVREAGFACACTGVERGVRQAHDRFQLPRVQAPNIDGAAFTRWLSQWL